MEQFFAQSKHKMEFDIPQKTEDTRNDCKAKVCEHFKSSNCEPALTPFKQRNGLSITTTPTNVFNIRNPFERGIVERLHMSFCSPTVFISKKKSTSDSEKFEWTIDEISQVNPANFEFCNSQFQVKTDPATESIAQNAINNFFNKQHIVLSPELNIKEAPSKGCLAEKPDVKSTCTQTEMTIPPRLSPGMEKILQGFCTYTQDQEETTPDTKEEFLRRNLFQDDHILHYANEQVQMEYSPLSPVANSPAMKFLLHSKLNHGTPTQYNIPSPSSVSPIDKKSPLRASSISPISKCERKSRESQFENMKTPKLRPTAPAKSLYYESDNKNNYPFSQSTPTTNKENQDPIISNKQNIIEECSPPYNQCYDDFQCNMMRRHKSISKIQFTEDMSVDTSKLETDNVDSPNIIEKTASIFTNGLDDFVKLDTEKFEKDLLPLSPMQTSQMETPLKKRSASAKNLSRSFGLPQEKDEVIVFSEVTNTRIDSGFTESFNTIDSVGEMTRYGNIQCHNCNNISKLNVLSFKSTSDLKCNYCSKSVKIL